MENLFNFKHKDTGKRIAVLLDEKPRLPQSHHVTVIVFCDEATNDYTRKDVTDDEYQRLQRLKEEKWFPEGLTAWSKLYDSAEDLSV